MKKQKYSFINTIRKGRRFLYPFDWENEGARKTRNKRESIRHTAHYHNKDIKLSIVQGFDKDMAKCLIIKRVK